MTSKMLLFCKWKIWSVDNRFRNLEYNVSSFQLGQCPGVQRSREKVPIHSPRSLPQLQVQRHPGRIQ